jgi:hypothetical protein
MAAFFILVMDEYKNDPDTWIYCFSARTEAAIKELECYKPELHGLPKKRFVEVSATRVNLPPCAGGEPEGGTIYGIEHL